MIIWELTIGDLFRIDDYWYRLNQFDKKEATVEIVGTHGKKTKLPVDTEITQLSILSMK